MAAPQTVPTPPLPADHAPSRASQFVLCGFAVVALSLLAFRGYGNGFGVRPTDQQPSSTRHRVDLNAADKAELLQVPGIGPALADAIITHRSERGSFAAVEDLHHVKGIGGKTLDKLRPWVSVSDHVMAVPVPCDTPIERLERKSAIDMAPTAVIAGVKLRPGDSPLNVNDADEASLQRLPGIGPTLARRIVDARGLDRFKSPDDLKRVKGIGPKTMESVRPYVVCR
jgi:competence protein ComEA